MSAQAEHELDPRFVAAVDMVRRTGSVQFQIRYQDDEEPTVWIATAQHRVDLQGRPIGNTGVGRSAWTVEAGLTGLAAVLRLCERLIDGGQCAHCGKPSAFDDGHEGSFLEPVFCWTQWDPELETYRRGCE